MPSITSTDPSLIRESTTPSVARTSPPTVSSNGTATSTGSTISRGITPIVSGNDVTYPQATQSTSTKSVTITSSPTNSSGDIVTVYTGPTDISVSSINQTVNNFTSEVAGVFEIIAGTGVTITSTGTGGTGAVTINSTAASVGNIAVLNLNGNQGTVLRGDGTWGVSTTSYSNSNVVSLLANFGSNTITTTGNVSVGNIIATNIGNISATDLDGNSSNVLYGNGVFASTSAASTGNIYFDQSTLLSNQSNAFVNLNGGDVGELALGTNDTNVVRVITDNEGANLQWVFDATGNLTIPGGGLLGNPYADVPGVAGLKAGTGAYAIIASNDTDQFIQADDSGLELGTNYNTNLNLWYFSKNGYATKPNDVVENTTFGVVCNAGAPTVIYTATSSGRSTIKLLLQVEGVETLGQQWDTQSCEMVVARGLRNSTVVGSVYGLAYTSVAPLATFNAVWNVTTSLIEITCTPTSLTYGVEARVHVIELTTSA